MDNLKKEIVNALNKSSIYSYAEAISVDNTILKEELNRMAPELKNETAICNIQSIYINDTIINILKPSFWWMKYRVVSHFGIFFIKLSKPQDIINISFTDTVYWDGPEISYEYRNPMIFKSNAKEYVPRMNEAYKEISQNAAEKFVNKITPCWKTEERILYFPHNKQMKKAYNSFCLNDLHNAIQEWQNVYTSNNGKLKYKAALNIALSYEVLDSLVLANEWIKKSAALKSDSIVSRYNRILNDRLKQKDLLNKQIPTFNN
jgi:hypothetical protein